jgi:hypothetical protein
MWGLTVLGHSGRIGEVEGPYNQSDLHERAVLVTRIAIRFLVACPCRRFPCSIETTRLELVQDLATSKFIFFSLVCALKSLPGVSKGICIV